MEMKGKGAGSQGYPPRGLGQRPNSTHARESARPPGNPKSLQNLRSLQIPAHSPVTKRLKVFSEARILSFRGELYNAFNHTQISSYNTSFQFNAAGQQLNPALGQANGARPPRNVQISARFVF
jgi:hypothetical protein